MSPLIRSAAVVMLLAVPVQGQELNEKASRYYESLLKRPAAGPVFDRFVDAWLDSDTLEHLESWLEAKVKEKPTVAGYTLLGLYHVRQGAHAKAVEQYRAALALEPANAALWQQKAIAESRLLEFDQAILSLQKGLEQKPAEELSLTMRQLLGRLLSRAGRTTDALTLWQKLMEERPNDEALREDVLDLQLAEGLFDAAIQNAAALVERTADPYKKAMRRLQAADVLDRAGRADAALAEWEKCLADSGTDSWLEKEVLARLDRAFRRDDNVSGLRAHLDALARRQPQRQGLQRARVRLLAELGEKSAALEAGRAMLALAPGDRAMRDEFIALLVEAGRQDEAVAQMNELVRQAPADRDLLLKLAGLKLQAGDKAGCLATILEYDKLSGADEAARLRSAALLEKAGLASEAIVRLQAAAREFPASTAVSQALAAGLHNAKRGGEALAEWKRLATAASGTALQDIARAMAAHGEDEAAWDLLSAKATSDSSDAPLLTQFCQLAERMNRADEALPRVRRLVALAQSAPDMEAALDLASRLIKRAGQTDDIIASIGADAGAGDLCLLAELMEQRGDSVAAEAALQRVTKAAPALAASQFVRLYRLRQAWPQAMEAGARLFDSPGGKKAGNAQMLADLADRARNPEEALRWTREWRKLSPGAAPAVLAEARLLRSLNKDDEALKVLRLASGQFEENREIREELARVCREAGRTTDALSIYAGLYEQAQDTSQKQRVMRDWALAAQEANRLPELIEQFEERRRQNRTGTGPLLSLAEIFAVSGDREKQRRALSDAARVKPEDADLALMLASMLEEDDLIPQAIETLKTAMPHDKSNRVRQRLARLHLSAGNQVEGMRLLEESPDGAPPDAEAVESMALSLAESDPARALTLLQARVQTDPDDYRLRFLLAVFLRENGDDAGALREWGRLLQVKQENLAVTSRRNAPLLSSEVQQKLQQLAASIPDEILAALRAHETSVATGQTAVQARMRAMQSQYTARTPVTARSLPGSVAELQALTVVTLASAFSEPGELQDAAKAVIKREGREPFVELLSKLPEGSLVSGRYGRHREDSDEPFPRLDSDVARGLHALMMLENAQMKVRSGICQEVWNKWHDSHPDFALAAGIAGVGAGAGVVEAWESEVLGRLVALERPSLLVLSGVQRFIGGDGAGRGETAQMEKLISRIAGWMEAPWMAAPAMDEVRRELTKNLVAAADSENFLGKLFAHFPAGNDELLARVLSAEWPHEEKFRPGQSFAQRQAAAYAFSSGTPIPYNSMPDGFLTALSWPPFSIPGVSPVFAGGDLIRTLNKTRAASVAKLVKIPTLRAWLEDRASDSGHPLEALTKLASGPSADPAALTLAAISSAEAEKYDSAVALTARALERPLPVEVRRLFNASLILWAQDGMAASGSAVHTAAREAALRLRRDAQSIEQKMELAEAMECLGLGKEAATLSAGGAGGYNFRFARRMWSGSMRGSGAASIRKMIMDMEDTSSAAVASVAKHLRRHARYMLSPAGWVPDREQALVRYRSDDDRAVSLEDLLKKLKDKGGADRILGAVDPGPNGDAALVAVFAVMQEVLGNKTKAVELYRKALSAGSVDAGVRVRLIMLLAELEPEAVREQFIATTPEGQAKLAEFFLPNGKREPLEAVLRMADLATAAAEKRDPALTAEYEWLNRLVTLLHQELPAGQLLPSPQLKGRNAPESAVLPLPGPELKPEERLPAKKKALEKLCRALLPVPGSAGLAFSSLRQAAPDADLVREAVTACVAESRLPVTWIAPSTRQQTQRSLSLLVFGGAGAEETVLTPDPDDLLSYLLDTAVKKQSPAPLRDALIPALEKAGSSRVAEKVSLLTDLYFNPPEQADGLVRRLIATSGESAWRQTIRGLAQRHLTVDPAPLLIADIGRARTRADSLEILTGAVVDYCDWQCAEGRVAAARAVLSRIVDQLAGTGRQRVSAIKAALQNSNFRTRLSSYNAGPAGAVAVPPAVSLIEMLHRLIQSRQSAFTALDVLYTEIVPQIPAEDTSALSLFLELEGAAFTKSEFFAVRENFQPFLEGSPMLADLGKFRSFGTAKGVFMMVIKAVQGMSAEERKDVMAFLDRQPAGFGRDVLAAACIDRWGASPLDAAGVHLDKIKTLPPSSQDELVELFSELASGRDRGKLTDAGVALLKWVQQQESMMLNADRIQSIDAYLNTRPSTAGASLFGNDPSEAGGQILETAIRGMSPRAYDVVRRTAVLARANTPQQITGVLLGSHGGLEMFPLPPDRSAFRLGVLTNTLCTSDRRTPLFDEDLRVAIPRTVRWITGKMQGTTEERLTALVAALSPYVKEGEGCVMLEAFPLPVTDDDTPEGRAVLRKAALAWAAGAGKSLPRQDLVREIAAAAGLEEFVETHPGATGIGEEAALPPEQAHYLSILKNEGLSLSARLTVASVLADFAGPWLEPPLVAQAATVLEKALATRRPLDHWQRLGITLAVGRSARHPLTDAAAQALRSRLSLTGLDPRKKEDRLDTKVLLLLTMRDASNSGVVRTMAALQETEGDPEVLAMVLRNGPEEGIRNAIHDAGSMLYNSEKVDGIEVFDPPLAAALEKAMATEKSPFVRMHAALAVNVLPSAAGVPSRQARFEALAAKMPEVLGAVDGSKREKLLALLSEEPVAAMTLEKHYLAAVEQSTLESLLKLNSESLRTQPVKFWMVLLSASASQGDLAKMTERFDGLRHLTVDVRGGTGDAASEALRHVCLGISRGWQGWDEAKRESVKDWFVERKKKGALLPEFDDFSELPWLAELPPVLQQVTGFNK